MTFSEAKSAILLGLYSHLLSSDGQVWVTPNEVQPFVSSSLSAGIIYKALTALENDDFVEMRSGGEDRNDYFGITEAGIFRAETIIVESGRSLEAFSGVPASDRVVTLDHNQIKIAETPLTEIIEALDQDNGLPNEPGIRERLLGQMRAGRELINAGGFKAYALYVTLVLGLTELVEKYQDRAIGALAKALLDLILKQILQGSK